MNTSRINIMVVDDDEDDRLALQESLMEVLSNFNFSIAENGNECLNMIRKGNHPDLLFMDLSMPIKNGIETLRSIHNENLLPETPIIIYSRSHHLKDIAAASEYGARFFLVKPDSAKVLIELMQRIVHLLGRSKVEQLEKSNFVIRQKNLSIV